MPKYSVCIALALAAFARAAGAQQVDCQKFSDAIEADQKTMALGAMSTSANSSEAALAAAAASRIQANLTIMQAYKCKPPTEPISYSYYISNALDCHMKSQFGSRAEATEACTTGKWERKK